MKFFIEFREDSERRLHNIASKTKDILKELAAEMNRRKKLSKVIESTQGLFDGRFFSSRMIIIRSQK